MALNGVWHAPVKTRTHSRFVAAELGNNGLLTLLHNKKARTQPHQQGHHGHGNQAQFGRTGVGIESTTKAAAGASWFTALTTALPAGSTANRSKQPTQLAIEVAPNFVQIWWTGIGTTALSLRTWALWVLP